jgi:hypothetical protein
MSEDSIHPSFLGIPQELHSILLESNVVIKEGLAMNKDHK